MRQACLGLVPARPAVEASSVGTGHRQAHVWRVDVSGSLKDRLAAVQRPQLKAAV